MQNILNLMKRKSEEQDRGSFIEYLGEILWKVFKKAGELIVKVIKRIIKEFWNSA